MTTSLSRRVFLASPGDAAPEREVVRGCVARFNANANANANGGAEASSRYEIVGHESVRGTARRPQEAINDLIYECHFLVAVFKASWGSEPGSPWGYSSGTEEEVFTALLDLAREARPMRDVWIAFMQEPRPDPRIVALKTQIVNSHALYFEECADAGELDRKLTERLAGWLKHDERVARRVVLIPSSGIDVLGADKLRADGETLIGFGYPDKGLEMLKQAARKGGPDEKLVYARFLGRSGLFDDAHRAVSEAIEHYLDGHGDMRSPAAAEAYAADAALSRRQQQYVVAVSKLQHALSLLKNDEPEWYSLKARVYDDLGLAYQAQRDLANARASCEAAEAIRKEIGDPALIAQSEVNLSRIHRALGNQDVAIDLAHSALSRLEGLPPTAVHANAFTLLSQQSRYAGRVDAAVDAARTSLALNQQFGNDWGAAISNYVLARALLAKGDAHGAVVSATESIRLNREMGNDWGAAQAEGLITKARAAGELR